MNEYGVDGLACSELVQGNATLKVGIEQTTTRYIQRYTLIETLVPAIMCLFVGPYSDEHGRKLPIVREHITCNQNTCLYTLVQVTGCLGITLTACYYFVLSMTPHVETWHFMTASLSFAVGGAYPVFGICIFRLVYNNNNG